MEAIQGNSSAIYPNTSAVTPQAEGKKQQMKMERTEERNRAEAGQKKEVKFTDAVQNEEFQKIDTVSHRKVSMVDEGMGGGTESSRAAESESGKYGNLDLTA